MNDDDIEDDLDDQPRVVYVDPEREGRLARYAAPSADDGGGGGAGGAGGGGGGGGVEGDGDGLFFAGRTSQSTVRSSGGHSAGGAVRGLCDGDAGVRAGGAALWASDDESDSIAPSLLNEEDDDLDAVGYVCTSPPSPVSFSSSSFSKKKREKNPHNPRDLNSINSGAESPPAPLDAEPEQQRPVVTIS